MTLDQAIHTLDCLRYAYDCLQDSTDNTLGDIHCAKVNLADAIRCITVKISARVNMSTITESAE